ncbi:hypothetical protein D3C73_1306260 [compost metagenome]
MLRPALVRVNIQKKINGNVVRIFSIIFSHVKYFFLKPYLSKHVYKDVYLLKVVLILMPITILFYWIITYFTIYDKPESFRKAVELLHNNETITRKIGDFESYSYYEYDLPNKSDNPANIKLSLKGYKAVTYISSEIVKDSVGKWQLIKINADSLIKND